MDTNLLTRRCRLLYKGDIVEVLTISKTSLRVYNISKNQYLNRWIEANTCRPLPLDCDILLGMGFEFDGFTAVLQHPATKITISEDQDGYWDAGLIRAKYHHELYPLIKLYEEYGNREKNKVQA